MDGLTINSSAKFLESQGLRDLKRIDEHQTQPQSETSADKVAGSFANTLNDAIQAVNQIQKTSDKKIQELSTGRTDNVADVMIASEKADIALKLMVQVRNKIIDTYQEIMKMQV